MPEFLYFLFILLVILTGLLLIYFKLKSHLEKGLQEPFISLKERLQDLGEIRRDLQRLYLAENLLKDLREEVFGLSQIFLKRTSGKAGERGLEELLSLFPPHLLKRDLNLGAGQVEFALVLSRDRFLPIDSKFVAPDLLKKGEISPEEERELLKRLKNRAREITPYLKDERTCGFAIMACPDGVFPYLQRRTFEDLERERILLLPYSMLPSVLLFIHFLFERFGRVLNLDALTESLSNLEKWILEFERDLERLVRTLKSAENVLQKLKETQGLLKRDFLKILASSQSSTSSRETSE